MEENKNVSEAISEIKNATEEDLRETIEKWFESTHTDGMKIGAQFIAAGVMGKFKKHLEKPGKISLRDYERCFADIKKMLLVQLTKQNDSTESNVSEEVIDD
jgi:hypothetical protein